MKYTTLSKYTLLFIALSFFSYKNSKAQNSLGNKADEETLPVFMNSHSVANKRVRSKKNIISLTPFQFTQKSVGIAYERLFGNNSHGIMGYYYYVSDEKTHDFNVQYNYYFKESKLKDFNFDQIRIKGFYFEYFTGLAYQQANNDNFTRRSIRVPIGARIQFKKGLNLSLAGLFGPGRQEGIKNPNFFAWGTLFTLGYRFHLLKRDKA